MIIETFSSKYKAKWRIDDRGGKDFLIKIKFFKYNPSAKFFKWRFFFRTISWASEVEEYGNFETMLWSELRGYADYELAKARVYAKLKYS